MDIFFWGGNNLRWPVCSRRCLLVPRRWSEAVWWRTDEPMNRLNRLNVGRWDFRVVFFGQRVGGGGGVGVWLKDEWNLRLRGWGWCIGRDTVYSVHTVHSYVLIERRGVSGFGITITSEQWKNHGCLGCIGIIQPNTQSFGDCNKPIINKDSATASVHHPWNVSPWSTQNANIYLHIYCNYIYIIKL